MLTKQDCKNKLTALSCCVIIPTYNNQKTVAQVITDVLEYSPNIIVVNDGATDDTPTIVKRFENKVHVISYNNNKGKGYALRTAFKYAINKGYRYAITIDSDGQHFAEDIGIFIETIEKAPDSILIGSRNLNQENMPKKNTFGNKFSNFWFRLFTHINLPDTQSGFRLYPIQLLKNIHFFSTKYEFEVEVIVKAAWRDIKVIPIPIKVFYAEADERVTHFRPGRDFTRISILNTYLFLLAFLWYKPKFLIKNLSYRNVKVLLIKNFLDSSESKERKALGFAFGVFMGIIPIWGYQFVSALVLAHFLKLNKAIVGFAAQISVPPMIPFLIYGSLKTGQLMLGKNISESIFNSDVNTISEIWATMKLHLMEYLLGSVVFAIVLGLLLGVICYFVLKLIPKKKA
jgi:glycosyltransferase involved in cell wall biosynthesis